MLKCFALNAVLNIEKDSMSVPTARPLLSASYHQNLRRRGRPQFTSLRYLKPEILLLFPLVKSLLEDGGIPYFARGEGVQDLLGLGRFGTDGFQVDRGDEKDAREKQ
ncbi:MAG: hypothetical protein DMG05_10980 [Acidobacteria bacterium]|nr:MAG: hypothetical protein DMG05_10980 [Acidobacteriota bacterium]